ncbi:MAG: M20/M25/M40 family metallo-hydrolase [Oscillospiraceae bacterium]|nr:M20/M25/M40 family metallo-hydrolase [Oscillospiraceae bacterium]
MNTKRLIETFSRYVACDSESGNERRFAELLEGELQALGLTVTRDEVGEKCGSNGFNVYGFLPGEGTPILFSAHMDTVSPGVGIEAVVVDGAIRSKGDTVLGADDKAGIAAVVEAIATVKEQNLSHRPVEVLFTVAEEIGLLGAKYADYSKIQSKEAIVLDNSVVGEMINSAPAMAEIHITVTGKSAHAAMSPSKGIHALKAAAAAVHAIECGHVDDKTVLNVANFLAPGPSNVVPEKASFDIDLRSFDRDVLEQHIINIESAVKTATDAIGASYQMDVNRKADLLSIPPDRPIIGRLQAVLGELGVTPRIEKTYGGSDATWLFANGIDAVNTGIGMTDVHSTDEYITVADLECVTNIVLKMMQ